MENALLEYYKSLTQLYKCKGILNYFKTRGDKDCFEYQVISYAESEVKKLEKKINSLKKQWNITY